MATYFLVLLHFYDRIVLGGTRGSPPNPCVHLWVSLFEILTHRTQVQKAAVL